MALSTANGPCEEFSRRIENQKSTPTAALMMANCTLSKSAITSRSSTASISWLRGWTKALFRMYRIQLLMTSAIESCDYNKKHCEDKRRLLESRETINGIGRVAEVKSDHRRDKDRNHASS